MATTYTVADLRNALLAAGIEFAWKRDETCTEALEVTGRDGSFIRVRPNTRDGGESRGIDVEYRDAYEGDEGQDWLFDVQQLVDLARDITKQEV